MWKSPDSCIYTGKFDKLEFFPYRHAIDLTIGLTHGIPLSTDSHEKTHSCSGVLLKIEQTLLALSHRPLGCRETRMPFVKAYPGGALWSSIFSWCFQIKASGINSNFRELFPGHTCRCIWGKAGWSQRQVTMPGWWEPGSWIIIYYWTK